MKVEAADFSDRSLRNDPVTRLSHFSNHRGMKKKIMIIENDQDILELITMALHNEGHTVIGSTNAAPLTEITRHSPDLLLLDNGLCDVPGHSICAELKRHPSTSRLPIVLVSGHAQLSVIARRCGADGYLVKPFNIGDLLAVVRRFP